MIRKESRIIVLLNDISQTELARVFLHDANSYKGYLFTYQMQKYLSL